MGKALQELGLTASIDEILRSVPEALFGLEMRQNGLVMEPELFVYDEEDARSWGETPVTFVEEPSRDELRSRLRYVSDWMTRGGDRGGVEVGLLVLDPAPELHEQLSSG
jgi:hypothetical protein